MLREIHRSAPVTAMDPSKIYMILPNLQLVPGSAIKPTDPTAMVVGNTVAYPPGDPIPFLSVGQTVKADILLIRIRYRKASNRI